jgi:type IV pilus assembly protein PilM
MQKIIGLDIGSYSIKAVEIINNFKSYEITNFYEKKVPHLVDPENPGTEEGVIPQCMEALFSENQIQADRIIAAMPGQYISSRILTFQFSDAAKIRAAVTGEIEDVVPFDLDDMIVDHQILGDMNGKTGVLVVMTKKKFLASFLEHLQRVAIDPKLVDVDSLSFYNLSPYLDMEPGKIYSLIDVGHEKTSICMIQDGILRMFRSINLGGRYITEFLARDLEVSFEEAEALKHSISLMILESDHSQSKLDGQTAKVASLITLAFQPIMKELARTFYAFKGWEKAPIARIYLSGGTAYIKNLHTYLTQTLEVETVPNNLKNTDLISNPDLAQKMLSIPQGLAIAMRAVTSVKRNSQINLRKGEFAYVQDYENFLRMVGFGLKIMVFLCLMFSGAYLIKYLAYQKQIDQVGALYRGAFVDALPDGKEKQKYKSEAVPFTKVRRDAETMLQDSVQSKRLAFESFVEQNGTSGSLAALRALSSGIPAEIKINLVEYNYRSQGDGTGKILLRIETDSFETIAQFKAALEGVTFIKDIKEKSSDTKPGTDLKIADIEVSYQPVKGGAAL